MPWTYGSPKRDRRMKLGALKQRPFAVICKMVRRNIGLYNKRFDYKRQMRFNLVCAPTS